MGHSPTKAPSVLVTGSTGFLGSRIVETLLNKEYKVRALVRKTSAVQKLKELNVEMCVGDLADIDSLMPAFQGIDCVVHAAAATKGQEEESRLGTIKGTENVLDLCEKFKIRKLIYISSCSVYGVADYEDNQTVSEDASLERFPEKRGVYSKSKLEAENLVSEAMNEKRLAIVCLRAASIWGPRGKLFSPMLGFSLKNKFFIIFGNGDFVLPFVYIDNLVESVIDAIENDTAIGKTYNVVDTEAITKKDYVNSVLKKIYPTSTCLYVPNVLLYMAIYIQEIVFRLLRRRPFLTRYRFVSSQKNVIYDSSKIINELGWKSSVPLDEAIRRTVKYELDQVVV